MLQDSPNIILICTDQQYAKTLETYGNSHVISPNLSRLAKGGAQFNLNFVSNPLCVPSRCSIMTGRYSNAHRSRSNETPLGRDEIDLPRVLNEIGYKRALIGKNHCFDEKALEEWDYVFEVDHVGPLSPVDETIAPMVEELKKERAETYFSKAVSSAVSDIPEQYWDTSLIKQEAEEFISQCDDRFFLWLSFPDPHAPYIAPRSYRELYDPAKLPISAEEPDDFANKPVRQWVSWKMMETENHSIDDIQKIKATYYAMITFIDDAIGAVVEALEKKGIADNTMIIFTSDHGDYIGEHNMVRKSPALYDSLVHVPLMFYWPSRIEPGLTIDALTSSIDIYPTVLECLGLPLPQGVQGKSVRSLLERATTDHRECVFAEVGGPGKPISLEEAPLVVKQRKEEYENNPNCRMFPWIIPEIFRGRGVMARTKGWKLIQYTDGDGELYDLERDPGELYNLYHNKEMLHTIESLRLQILKWTIDRQDMRSPVSY